jgi:hypothetical protein
VFTALPDYCRRRDTVKRIAIYAAKYKSGYTLQRILTDILRHDDLGKCRDEATITGSLEAPVRDAYLS